MLLILHHSHHTFESDNYCLSTTLRQRVVTIKVNGAHTSYSFQEAHSGGRIQESRRGKVHHFQDNTPGFPYNI